VTAPQGPVVLVVLDGIAIGRPDETNAVYLARTPTLDALTAGFPHTELCAHGTAVGLPSADDMGNSEVGHNALGAGRVFDQGAKLVNRAISTGSIWETALWAEIMTRCTNGGTLHFIGLLSDGNVHSHIDHLFSLLHQASREGVHRVRVHPLLDGRDVPPTSALEYIHRLEWEIDSINRSGFDYRIASGGGRMVTTMDRYEADWKIVKRGWDAHVEGKGRGFPDAETAIGTYRREEPGLSDQFISPFVITEDERPIGKIEDGDAVVLFNFRGDRAIEISRAFDEKQFDKFDRSHVPDVLYAGMMEYDGDLHIPKQFLVHPPAIDRTISAYLVSTGMKQLAIAETQKFGHVTYFWNGNRSGKFSEHLETYIELNSDQVPFEQRPWMKAAEVTDQVLVALESPEYRFIRVNYANGDMVGHTGKMSATIIAVEAVDLCLARLWSKVRQGRGVLIVTADHGNADQMYQLSRSGEIVLDEQDRPLPLTSHTLNPVVFLIADERKDPGYVMSPPSGAGLSNVAATILNLLGYEKPEEYDTSLIQPKG
jgi:2,3-bisphosphoglycerate-independent phosphoglycerate mutase